MKCLSIIYLNTEFAIDEISLPDLYFSYLNVIKKVSLKRMGNYRKQTTPKVSLSKCQLNK